MTPSYLKQSPPLIKRFFNGTCSAFAFLTVIPIPARWVDSSRAPGHALIFFPLVGLVIGALMVASAIWLSDKSALLAAVWTLCISIGVTGALHMDGLADTADAWGGSRGSRERALDIMRDPRCGAFGVTAVVMVCLLNVAALTYLIEHRHWWPIFLAPVAARCALLPMLAFTPYVRAQGIGSDFAAQAPPRLVTRVMWLMATIAVAVAGWIGFYAVAATLAGVWILRAFFKRWLGGITGDTLGATVIVLETVVLMVGVVVPV